MKFKNYKLKIVKIAMWCWATLPRKIISCLVIAGILLSSIWFLLLKPKPAEAGWFDEDWLYRRAVVVTNNTTAETDVYVEITGIDTSDTTKFQADCGDLRFTKKDGTLLDYYIVSGCGTASTTVHVKLDTLVAGAQTIYFYYGNSSAENGFIGTDFSTVASSYSVGAIGSEEKGLGPVLWLKFDEGYGTLAYNSTPNDAGKLPGLQLDTTHPLAQGLVGMWLMNEGTGNTIADLSGNGKTGTIQSGVSWVAGLHGSSLDFDGTTNAYVSTSIPLRNNDLTYVVWAYIRETKTSGSLIGQGTGRLTINSANPIKALCWDGSSFNYLTSTISHSLNTWNQFAYTKSSTLGAAIYVNGVLGNSNAGLTQNASLNNPTFRFGYLAGDATYAPNAIISMGIFYNRALSASEIAQLYAEPFAMISDTGASKISGASWTDSGKFGKALDFDGTDDVVTVIRGDTNVGLLNKSAYSVSAWIYPHSGGENGVGEIIDKGANTYIRVDSEGSDGYLDLEAGLDLDSGDPTLNIENAVQVNRWSHILLVWEDDSDDEFTIYVNGINMGTSSGGDGAPADDSDSDLLIGGGTGAHFDGVIDEVIIYPYARSAVQAKRNYNQGAAARIGRDDSWLTDGLNGYWKMNESSGNAADSSGAGTTLTNTGTATFAGGKFANGASLDGSTQYFYAADNAALSITGDIALSAWIYTDSVSGSHDIVGKWDGTNESYLLSLEGDELRMWIDDNSKYKTTDSANLAISTWYLVTGVYNAYSGTVRLYVNGEEKAGTVIGTIPTSIADDTGRFQVGAEDSTSSAANFFDGTIDDVRVYNRQLSGFEIMRLYDWGPGPVGYWSMDEGSGTSVNDLSENANTGTITGATSGTITGATWKNAAECKFGNCLEFDGAGDYVETATVDASGLTGLTYSFWIKTTATASQYPLSWSNQRFCRINYVANKINCAVDGSSSGSAATTSNVNDGNWHHIALTSTSNSQIIYFDGVNESTASESLSAISGTIQIGAIQGASFWNGTIDDVRIYNYALTPKQITEVMMGGRPAITETTSSPGAMAGYWKFDEGFGTTAYDASGRSNNLTLSASAEAWTMSGKFGKAWDGDATKYLSRPDDDDFDFTETEDFSISGWFKHSPISEADYIIAKHQSTVAGGYKVYMDADGDIVFAIDQDGTWDTTDVIGDDQSRNYDDNAWHYFAGVKRGISSIRLYVDGREIDNDTSLTETGSLANAASLYVGIDANGSTGPFDGELDEIKIYRFALSPEEILLDYNKGKAVQMGAVGTESDATTPSWSQSRAYCPPGYAGLCSPPVGEYKFDEYSGSTAYDTSGNINNGAITGASWKGSADCKYNSCLNFDGTDDVVTVTQDSSINMSGKSGYTMSAWIYPHSDGENDVGEIIDKGTNTYLRVDTESGGLDVEAKLDLDTTDATLNIEDAISINTWSHILMTYEDDSDDEITIYVNGINKGSSTDGDGSLAASDTNNLLIGGDTAANFDGHIDDVKIFDYALSQEQVAWVYNKGKPVGQWKFDEGEGPFAFNSTTNDGGKLPGLRLDTTHPLSQGLVGLWLMNEGTGNTIADLSGNGNTGTITNALWTPGKLGSCLSFDGTGDWVTVPDSDLFSFGDGAGNDKPFSISGWFNISDITLLGGLIGKYGAVGSREWRVLTYVTRIYLALYTNLTNAIYVYLPLTSAHQSVWLHFVGTYDGSKNQAGLKIYINGNLATTTNLMDGTYTGMANTSRIVEIGATSGTNSFLGLIDFPMIYNRALSASEIAQLYREPFAMISDTGASTITGATWNSSGKFNSALDFDGDDDVVTVVADSDIDLNNKTAYSVCGWINPDSDGQGDAGEWFSKGNSYVRVDTESGSTVEVSALFDLATSNASLTTTKTIPTNSWSHICTTWKDDSDDELTIYINGANAGSSTNGSGAPADDSTSNLYIGGDSSNNFDGDIDEVKIYNYELSSEQVKLDYNQGAALRFGD